MADVGEAVQSAVALSTAAPFLARRSVVNILSNGVDNNGPTPDAARDQAIRMGITINGIVFGERDDLADYFRQHVIGGPGAFIMTVEIGRAHVCTPVTTAHLVCRLLHEK